MPKLPYARFGIQIGGVIFIALSVGIPLLSPQPGRSADWWIPHAFGTFPLISFLWLVLTGFFGYASAGKRDWIAIIPFVVALIVREFLTLHSIGTIVINFANDFWSRHSVLYPAFQLFFVPLIKDSQNFIMHLNGILGALATLPLYLFTRQRTESRVAAFLAAMFLAANPVVARFAPTDLSYSLLLLSWFSGLALLSAAESGALSMTAGITFLGIAATCRMEGILYFFTSFLMLDPRLLYSNIRRHKVAVILGCVTAAVLWMVQMRVLFAFHNPGPSGWGLYFPSSQDLFKYAIVQPEGGNEIFRILIGAGILAGLIHGRWRLGPGAFLALLISVAPLITPGETWILSAHRLVPCCALQSLIAAIGVSWLAELFASLFKYKNLAGITGAIIGTVLSLSMLYQHKAYLSESYVFNHEYDLVRRHFVNNGPSESGCTLVSFTGVQPAPDNGIQSYLLVVPPTVTVHECIKPDCQIQLSVNQCVYYVRSGACYFHQNYLPAFCEEAGMDKSGNRLHCINAACASFENNYELKPVDTRVIDFKSTFPGQVSVKEFPASAEIGLFRVIRAKNQK